MIATAMLLTHRGAQQIERRELDLLDAPAPTSTWFPVRHADVIDAVTRTLGHAGFAVNKSNYAVSHGNARMFATMDLSVPLHAGVSLAIGIRNSNDKSFPLGFCAGSRVFVCDNLAFSAELMVKRKHTRFGKDRFRAAIADAVSGLDQFVRAESRRIRFMQERPITDDQAESLILRGWERGILSHRNLPAVINEWRNPSFDYDGTNTIWQLYNAFTTVLAGTARRNPQRHALLTIDLKDMIEACFPNIVPVKMIQYASAA